MNFSIGDKVVIRSTQEPASIVNIVNEELVWVDALNLRFPIFLDEIMIPEVDRFTSQKVNQKKKSMLFDDFDPEIFSTNEIKSTHIGFEDGIHFAFFPIYMRTGLGDELFKFRIYLINQTKVNFKIKYECVANDQKLYSLANDLKPYKHQWLHNIRIGDMNDLPRFSVLMQQQVDKTKSSEFDYVLKIKPKQIFDGINKIDKFSKPYLKFTIFGEIPDAYKYDWTKDEIFTYNKVSTKYQFITNLKQESEIDLHIEKLIRKTDMLDNFEILTIQLRALETAIEKAISFRQASLIVIHGVGEGKLRTEVHALLKKMKKEIKHFENKYSAKYGFGATEIFFK